MKMKIETVEKVNAWCMGGMEMLIWRRYKALHAALFPLELSLHLSVSQYLFNYGSLEGDGPTLPSLHAQFNV